MEFLSGPLNPSTFQRRQRTIAARKCGIAFVLTDFQHTFGRCLFSELVRDIGYQCTNGHIRNLRCSGTACEEGDVHTSRTPHVGVRLDPGARHCERAMDASEVYFISGASVLLAFLPTVVCGWMPSTPGSHTHHVALAVQLRDAELASDFKIRFMTPRVLDTRCDRRCA
jgi:hypothetical protein